MNRATRSTCGIIGALGGVLAVLSLGLFGWPASLLPGAMLAIILLGLPVLLSHAGQTGMDGEVCPWTVPAEVGTAHVLLVTVTQAAQSEGAQ